MAFVFWDLTRHTRQPVWAMSDDEGEVAFTYLGWNLWCHYRQARFVPVQTDRCRHRCVNHLTFHCVKDFFKLSFTYLTGWEEFLSDKFIRHFVQNETHYQSLVRLSMKATSTVYRHSWGLLTTDKHTKCWVIRIIRTHSVINLACLELWGYEVVFRS